jgi:hypothetical protein
MAYLTAASVRWGELPSRRSESGREVTVVGPNMKQIRDEPVAFGHHLAAGPLRNISATWTPQNRLRS